MISSAYQLGFANEFSSEALANTLPIGQNSPQVAPRGLYAEQLSGSAFTAPRAENTRSWLYRMRPSVQHEGSFSAIKARASLRMRDFSALATPPTQFRWDPTPLPASLSVDFIDGLNTMVGNGNPLTQHGAAMYTYACTASMTDRFFYSADGEFLIVPWQGALKIKTELGTLEIAPGYIGCIPRGIKFQVQLEGSSAQGYVCENFGRPFRLPELGPIGANGLANRRDFETPHAAFEERSGVFELVAKFGGHLFSSQIHHSPFDVVAWHGNYAPYRYDLFKFNVMGSISFDHPDPSIFTVLSSPSDQPGTANLDFVAFAPRWLVMENTFRPPYFHRNAMSEFMGLVQGDYDAKIGGGFQAGGMSLHNCMSGHGPDADTFRAASAARLEPHKLDNTMAFMFESRYIWHPTEYALTSHPPQSDYRKCWDGLPMEFKK